MQGRAVRRGRGLTEARVLQIAILEEPAEDEGKKYNYRLAPDCTQQEMYSGTSKHCIMHTWLNTCTQTHTHTHTHTQMIVGSKREQMHTSMI